MHNALQFTILSTSQTVFKHTILHDLSIIISVIYLYSTPVFLNTN